MSTQYLQPSFDNAVFGEERAGHTAVARGGSEPKRRGGAASPCDQFIQGANLELKEERIFNFERLTSSFLPEPAKMPPS